jgi:hypothetical protein
MPIYSFVSFHLSIPGSTLYFTAMHAW